MKLRSTIPQQGPCYPVKIERTIYLIPESPDEATFLKHKMENEEEQLRDLIQNKYTLSLESLESITETLERWTEVFLHGNV